MASKLLQPEDDCTCPVCSELFTDPVLLLCSHSFCQFCLNEWWKRSGDRTCPVCKEVCPGSFQPPQNLALRNLSDNCRQVRSQAESGSKELCELHEEKLKLFCQDDQQLICLICKESTTHKKHSCIPVDEAAEEHREKLRIGLIRLKTQLGSSEHEKNSCDRMASHITVQAQQTEQSIREEFQMIHQLLHAEEAERIDALQKETALKSEAMKTRIEKWNAEISSITEKVQTIEKEIKTSDTLLMQNITSTVQSLQHTLPDDKDLSGPLIDQAKHLGNLQYSVWIKMLQNAQYTSVILDPNTASSKLNVSTNLTGMRTSDKCQPFPNNPERLDFGILGYQGFSCGVQTWDVEVSVDWAVGVSEKTSKGRIWGIMGSCSGILCEFNNKHKNIKIVCEDNFPQKLRVMLDYDQGVLAFFDLVRNTYVHTIKYKFKKTLFPYFGNNVSILPVKVTQQRQAICKK